MKQVNKYIKKFEKVEHNKASEKYIKVEFYYPEQESTWKGWVPIEYRRTGIFTETEEEINELLKQTYKDMNPENKNKWFEEQKVFWGNKNAYVTENFFEKLKDGNWTCQNCELPDNANWARRVQDIKECGYTIATNTNTLCDKCGEKATHLLMLHIPRGGQTGYETIPLKLREKILDTLNNFDVYENTIKNSGLLPDHKFPEIRWDSKTMEDNSIEMSEKKIKQKFQLINNRRNQQKREACRKCYQTGKRGFLYGIKYFYEGDENWEKEIPKRGKEAEEGCIGCGWYDIQKWRSSLNEFIKKYK